MSFDEVVQRQQLEHKMVQQAAAYKQWGQHKQPPQVCVSILQQVAALCGMIRGPLLPQHVEDSEKISELVEVVCHMAHTKTGGRALSTFFLKLLHELYPSCAPIHAALQKLPSDLSEEMRWADAVMAGVHTVLDTYGGRASQRVSEFLQNTYSTDDMAVAAMLDTDAPVGLDADLARKLALDLSEVLHISFQHAVFSLEVMQLMSLEDADLYEVNLPNYAEAQRIPGRYVLNLEVGAERAHYCVLHTLTGQLLGGGQEPESRILTDIMDNMVCWTASLYDFLAHTSPPAELSSLPEPQAWWIQRVTQASICDFIERSFQQGYKALALVQHKLDEYGTVLNQISQRTAAMEQQVQGMRADLWHYVAQQAMANQTLLQAVQRVQEELAAMQRERSTQHPTHSETTTGQAAEAMEIE